MKASEIFQSVRFDLGDTSAVAYSAYQLLFAFNDVMRAINTALGNLNSTLVQKTVALTMVNGSAALPSDFDCPVYVKAIYGLVPQTAGADVDKYTYKIIGNSLYATENVTLIYNASFTPYILDTNSLPTPDTISWPDSLFNAIKARVLAVIANPAIIADAQFLASLQNEVSSKVVMRERTQIYRKPLINLYSVR